MLGALLAAGASTPPAAHLGAERQSPGAASTQTAAANAAYASISGTVKSASGASLAGANVTLTNEATSVQRVAVTAADGAYTLDALAPAIYSLLVERPGFETASHSHLSLDSRQRVIANFSLAPRPDSPKGRPGGPASGLASGAGTRAEPGQGSVRFDYFDKPDYKPGEVSSSPDSGGYSAPAYADSYDLILDYVRSGKLTETGSVPVAPGRGAERSDAAKGRVPEDEPVTEAIMKSWNENQFFSHGSALLLRREYRLADEMFRHGAARFPESVKLDVGLGIALYALGQYDEAVDVFMRATDLVPSDPHPYMLLGTAYKVSSARNDDVRKHLERLVKLDPHSAPARYYYALSLWKGPGGPQPDTNLEQVEALLKGAVTLDPHFPDAHLELGALYVEQAKYSAAIDEYRQAIRWKPDLAAAHYRLAQAYTRAGDRAAARAELDAYQRLRKARPGPSE